ncbi:Peroxisomal biogenesis factor 19 [Wickerhamomyces ciferrii]|uniref:Peroxisomal biogenesis factor 19 n=1 Tax=Wickerhamomyces ciferrii (strain ATCC 14091 / BCRC 22168 / CBS 111 / JCM 3599 / NBRC 0793 / NRRL Y-1031 F-60-10) TaxID=1206466 RepID=K0KSI8_WICCF|nr:Peroxisomal biogenesis factor 19 [Wickerhamomyces ciferrii]CCH46136.1 Peroxisomal biogenesis factor 19 [Wickerhamomyces ciferrii]
MPSEEKLDKKQPVGEDLDDLDDLDDYLDDFADDILSKPPGHDLESHNQDSKDQEKDTTIDGEPLSNSDKQQIEDLLKQLESESPEARQQLDALLKDVSTLNGPSDVKPNEQLQKDSNDKDLKDTISSTLNRLKSSGAKVDESIKSEEPDQFLNDLFNQLNLDGEGNPGEDGDFDITKLLGDMLEQLASKEILYDPLKDLSSKYPKWIEENKNKITKEKLERYTKQSDIVKSIVDKFDEESYSDSSKPHKEFISTKLEEMQNSGNPPEDLVGDFNKTGLPGLNFGNDDLPDNLDKELEQNCANQ